MWWYLRARFLLWLLRQAGRVIKWAALAAVLVAAAPVAVVAAVGLAGTWLRGWPAARLRRAPSCHVWAPDWTVPAPWPVPTRGTSSSKAPASRALPKPRRWP